jgi:hypothetical protein
MSKDETWIGKQLQECKSTHESVTDSTVARLKDLLEGKLGERPLTHSEMTATAAQLMDDMSKPVTPKTEGGNEN